MSTERSWWSGPGGITRRENAMLMAMLHRGRHAFEGLVFRLTAPSRLDRGSAYARDRKRHGLHAFRKGWWIHSRHERYTTLARYARLLDWAMAEPKGKAGVEVLPPGARLVVFRMGHLGDILHLMPALAEIKRQRPDVRIELVTGPWNRDVLARYPWLDAVHPFTPDVYQFNRGHRGGVRSLAEEQAFIRHVRGDGVDTVFCPAPPHFAEWPVIVGLRPARFVGGACPQQLVPDDMVCQVRTFDSRHYEMDAVADYLPMLGLERKPVRLAYPVSADSIDQVEGFLRVKGWSNDRLVALFPGSGWPGKCWPPASFAALADALVDDYGVRILLAGSPSEADLCRRVAAGMRHPAEVVAGAFTLDASAALIARCVLVVGNDSAPIHFAAALTTPTLSFWGPTFPEKWAPREGPHRVVRRAGACSGCTYWHPAARCTGRPPCIETITVAAARDEVAQSRILCPAAT